MDIEEFEELFGNTPFENIVKIKKYIKDKYISKDKIREALDDGILDAKGWGEEGGADIVAQKILILLEEE